MGEHTITKIPISTTAGDDAAFVLRGFLTPQECQKIISEAEESGNLQSCGYDPSIRRVDRWENNRNDLAVSLFERVQTFLESAVDLSNPDKRLWPIGVPRNSATIPGLWKPTHLNPRFRTCRYHPGGFFLPHHDGQTWERPKVRSLHTLMIYLNRDFDGGPTNFYNERQSHYQEGQPWLRTDLFQPQTGDALIFRSSITHDGGTVLQGKKYILRTEIMSTWQHSVVSGQEQKERVSSTIPPDHDELADFEPDEIVWSDDEDDDDNDIIEQEGVDRKDVDSEKDN